MSFVKMRPPLERIFGVLGILDNIMHYGGLLYNGHKWQWFSRDMGISLVKCSLEHTQSNGTVLVKIVHAAITKGRDLRTEVQKKVKRILMTELR